MTELEKRIATLIHEHGLVHTARTDTMCRCGEGFGDYWLYNDHRARVVVAAVREGLDAES